MKMVLKIIGIIFLVLVVVMGGMVIWAFSYHKKLKALPINDIDLSKVKDGKYEGKFEAKMWTTPVEVDVQDHKIKDIKITRDQYSMPDSENQLLARIIQKQSLNVDAIAGATITTISIKKSVEDALNKGLTG